MPELAHEGDGAPQEPCVAYGATGYRALILVVDDNRAAGEALRDYLEVAGYRVTWACSGMEAIAAVTAHRPDVILMDVMMPGLDGIATTERIRSLPGLTATRIIMVSALAMPDDRARGIAAGADEYLCKPIRLAELAAAIQRQLNRLAGGAV